MSEPLTWSKKRRDYSTGVTFGAMFFVVFGLLLDDLVMGVVIGVVFFIVFSNSSEKQAVSFDGQTLRLVEDDETTEVPAEHIETVDLTDGDMIVRTKTGEVHALESEDDGLRAFVEKLREEL